MLPVNSKINLQLCLLCGIKLCKYCCPRCGVYYCSLDCYKCEKHQQCSEDFYKECIEEEMSAQTNNKEKMMEIIKRIEEAEESQPDSDDGENIELSDRLANIDLDNCEDVWKVLTDDERNEFESLVKCDDLTNLIELWSPWWIGITQPKLVEEITKDSDVYKKCPFLYDKIVDFSEISKRTPSDCIKYNLINMISSYVFICRYFNGDYHNLEAISYLVSLSQNLVNNYNYDSLEEAVENVAQQCLSDQKIETDEESLNIMRDDVAAIITCHNTNLVLSILSDIRQMFLKLKSSSKNNRERDLSGGEFIKKFNVQNARHLDGIDVKKINNILKKIDYYLFYVKMYGLSL